MGVKELSKEESVNDKKMGMDPDPGCFYGVVDRSICFVSFGDHNGAGYRVVVPGFRNYARDDLPFFFGCAKSAHLYSGDILE